MSMLPRSLFGRTVLVVVATLIVSQAVSVWLFQYYVARPRAQAMGAGAVQHIRTVLASLESLPPEQHRVFIQNLRERKGIRIVPQREWEAVDAAPDTPGVTLLRDMLRKEFGPEVDVLQRPRAPRPLWVKISSGGQSYFLQFPRNPVAPDFSSAWIGWTTASVGLALFAAFILVTLINRPLKSLEKAAHDFGRSGHFSPAPQGGPTEIASLAQTFNRMGEDVERVNRERALLLAGVSHDLRTPLARLRLATEMLPESVDADTRSAIVEDIDDMNSIVAQFLDFARGEAGEAPAPTDLAELSEEVARRYTRGGYVVSVEAQRGLTPALRPLAIKRLLANLIDNALKHGGGEIVVRAQRSQNPLRHEDGFALSVLDRGPGIKREDAERLLQPFTRADPSRAGESGAGLGLAIAARIAKLHGATLELLPREGGGLEARVEFAAG